MADIFISYSHLDVNFASELVEKLKERRISCFIDKENIPAGIWSRTIGHALNDCSLLIVLCSQQSMDSIQVLSEIIFAKTRNKIIVPIKIGMFDFTEEMELNLTAYQILDGMRGITPKMIDDICTRLKNRNNTRPHNERLNFAPPIDANINGPIIKEISELLDIHYSINYITMKHIELDYLTVDKNKYDIDDDIEGTLDDWVDMVGDTAECSAQLISNDVIVGYLDFIPVTQENYDLLVTNKKCFTSDLMAYYTFGGKFDIYASMFSIDYNYATPSNYFLFFTWMIRKLIKWKDEGIIINRITFSIYLDSQAKALELLGFKLIFENRIKGKLYESTFEDLMKNPIVINKILKG